MRADGWMGRELLSPSLLVQLRPIPVLLPVAGLPKAFTRRAVLPAPGSVPAVALAGPGRALPRLITDRAPPPAARHAGTRRNPAPAEASATGGTVERYARMPPDGGRSEMRRPATCHADTRLAILDAGADPDRPPAGAISPVPGRPAIRRLSATAPGLAAALADAPAAAPTKPPR